MEIPPVIQAASLLNECVFTTSRSSGPGGQNVNKVESRVTLKLDILNSSILSPEQKDFLTYKLAGHLTREGVLILNSQESRSQAENKNLTIVKLETLLSKAFIPVKSRKATKPGKAEKETTGIEKTPF